MSTSTGFARVSTAAGRRGFWVVRDSLCRAWRVTDLTGQPVGPRIMSGDTRDPLVTVHHHGGYRLDPTYPSPEAFFAALEGEELAAALSDMTVAA